MRSSFGNLPKPGIFQKCSEMLSRPSEFVRKCPISLAVFNYRNLIHSQRSLVRIATFISEYEYETKSAAFAVQLSDVL